MERRRDSEKKIELDQLSAETDSEYAKGFVKGKKFAVEIVVIVFL